MAGDARASTGPTPTTYAALGAGESGSNTTRRRCLAAALLAIGLVAFLGAKLGPSPEDSSTAAPSPSLDRPAWPETAGPTRTVTRTAPPLTVTRRDDPPTNTPAPRTQSPPSGDLGLPRPFSRLSCTGQGIVVLGSVTTPGRYPEGVHRLLGAHPGASYLRTDQTCPSLRAATEEGDPIYAGYVPAGDTTTEVCAAVRSAGGDAYGKWLDYTTDPTFRIPCGRSGTFVSKLPRQIVPRPDASLPTSGSVRGSRTRQFSSQSFRRRTARRSLLYRFIGSRHPGVDVSATPDTR